MTLSKRLLSITVCTGLAGLTFALPGGAGALLARSAASAHEAEPAAATVRTAAAHEAEPAAAPAPATTRRPAAAPVPGLEPSSTLIDQSSRLAGQVVVAGRTMRYLEELTDLHPYRLTGTDGYERAAKWAADQFRQAGLKQVRLETFTIPNGWERGETRGRIVSPVSRELHLTEVAWSPPTPKGGLKSEVILLGDMDTTRLKGRAGELKGKIVLLDTEAIFGEERFRGMRRLAEGLPTLKEVGVASVLWPSRASSHAPRAHQFYYNQKGKVAPLPGLDVGMEDALMLRRMLAKGPVTLELHSATKVTGERQVSNVIAELPGSSGNGEYVLIGAHLDAWDFATGAQDNGAGVAMVLEAARVMAALGKPPLRTVRFALWSGEEQGLMGSEAWTIAHAGELGRCAAMLNVDNGPGEPKGWKVQGRPEVAQALRPLANGLLAGLGAEGVSEEMTMDSDHAPFMLRGVPTLDMWVDMTKYFEVHHGPADTLDKVSPRNLASGAAILSVTAWAVADHPQRIASRLDRAGIEAFLKRLGREEMLKRPEMQDILTGVEKSP